MQFLNDVLGVMRNHSLDRTHNIASFTGQLVVNPNLKVFEMEPNITPEDNVEAHKWNSFNKEVRRFRGMYIVKAHKPENENDFQISKADCELYFETLRKSSTLDAYLDNVHSFHTIRIQTDN